MLGLVNNDLDPNTQMNVWLSSAENHQWNPAQKTPATAGVADGKMKLQERLGIGHQLLATSVPMVSRSMFQ